MVGAFDAVKDWEKGLCFEKERRSEVKGEIFAS
jgi:hypothetical protein